MRAAYHWSTRDGLVNQDALKRLLATMPDVDAGDASGWTPLMVASYANRDGLSLLLKAGADPNRTSLHGDTALHFAAYGGDWDDALVKAGARVNQVNADGVSSLMLLAQSWADADVVLQALKDGADPSLKDRAGRTALDYLLADGCGKPVVAHPEPRGMVARIVVKKCPPDWPGFRAKRDVLERAMRARR